MCYNFRTQSLFCRESENELYISYIWHFMDLFVISAMFLRGVYKPLAPRNLVRPTRGNEATTTGRRPERGWVAGTRPGVATTTAGASHGERAREHGRPRRARGETGAATVDRPHTPRSGATRQAAGERPRHSGWE